MNEWVETRLGDLIEIKHGYAFKGKFFQAEPNGNILVTPGNFNIGGGFKTEKFKYYTGKVPEDYILRSGDIIVTMTDLSKAVDTLGYSAKVPKDKDKTYLHNQRIGLVKPKNTNIYLPYIYWLMRSPEYRWHVVSSASGSTVSHTSPSRIQEYLFYLPSRTEQKAISAVLSSLDDKIDLLHRQNKTLEALAKTLFRHWFIDEAEDDWKDGCLEDVAVNIRNSVKSDQVPNDTVYIGLEHIDKKCVALYQHGFAADVKSNKYQFDTADILFGKLRPYFHKVCFTPYSGICSTDILVLRPKQPHFFSFALFAFFQKEVIDYADMGSSGTRMPRINWKTLRAFPMQIPPDCQIRQFNELIYPSIQKIKHNIEQIRTLGNLRDTLLPKLMSGEVRVQL